MMVSSLQIIFVSKQVICSARDKLARSQSGQTKHLFPSCVYANWYCGPGIKLKCSIFVHNLQVTLDHKCPVTVSNQAKILPVKT